MADSECVEPAKKKQFKLPTRDEEIAVLSKGVIPPNTEKNTKWAMRVFSEWRYQRNSELCKEDTCSSHLCPDDLLDDPVPEKLNYWLCRFVSEVRHQDGNPYPPRAINQILAGLQRHILEVSPNTPKLLDKSVSIYRDLHRTYDTVYRQLHGEGIGMNVQHTEPFTGEEEAIMWKSGALSVLTQNHFKEQFLKHFCI